MISNELSPRLFARTARALDFDEIREMLASHCKTEAGAGNCRSLVPTAKVETALSMLDETGQMIAMLQAGGRLFTVQVSDPGGVLLRVSKGKLPEDEDIKAMVSFLNQLKRLVEFRESQLENAAALLEICSALDPLDEMTAFFSATFDGAGAVKSSATALLMELDLRIQSLRRRINEKAEKLLTKEEMEERLQDSYITIRNGRMVLPVKAEYKNIFSGIIHGISATEKTAFMEPQELVKDNNELQEALSEREEEVHRLLRQAAQMLREQKAAIAQNYELTARLDVISARAQVSILFKGTRPLFNGDGSISITELRHPMMVARGENPRPNSLFMNRDERTLILSGPNGGGKTVFLKTVGLVVVLGSCGVFPPIGAGSKFPFVRKLFALVGDEQSIAEGRSSFTAHLVGLKEALEEVADGTWVIVDEMMHGTDPAQATVLAEAMLEFFAGNGCRTFVSTHLPRLKMAAQNSPEMVNAAMGVGEDGRPTFSLSKGHPGMSHPLVMAKEVGIPDEILEYARKRLSTKEDRYQNALNDIQEKAAKLDRQLSDYEKRKREAAALKEQLEMKLKEAERNNEEFEKNKNRRLRHELSGARAELAAIVEEARQSDRQKRAEAAKRLKKMENELVVKAKRGESVPIEELKEGDPVWIIPFDREARLVKIGPDENVELLCGKVRMMLSRGDIIGVRAKGKKPAKQPAAATGPVREEEESSLSLLGLTFDEAMPELERFLDSHMLTDARRVLVIHGKGTLKVKITAYLRDSPYVKSFTAASPEMGGDGASLVYLKD